ncbi:uncharacterized protein I303_101616 [Kwoniella dejecticola CBS 10117]|uniref:Exoribonuclease phosphorolytic domain-containing protein n=1 Tax=Kwoniella dejecticola CBS 10117 TaxID=1296121 RepID=A0A1A6AD89_9TREE|nr:uncharacterized protein I303_02249 [Kwoniella dejecticola CBS 10117]OBR88031.1 hypothetical protein I303_02249 [Kwoniella dejecticola CBS 10117]
MSNNAGPSRRHDGRRYDEIRPLQIEIGELDRADGSGRFGFGSNAALASCSGPLEVRLNKELPTRATLEVSHRPLEGVGATPSRALVTTLESIFPTALSLPSYPRSLIQLIVQSLSSSSVASSSATSSSYDPQVYIDVEPDSGTDTDIQEKNVWPQPQAQTQTQNQLSNNDDIRDGTSIRSPNTSYPFSTRATAINASTLACLDNGSVKMTNLPIAISIACLSGKTQTKTKGLVVDPTTQEEGDSSSRFGFGWSFGENVSLALANNKQVEEGQGDKMDIEGEGEDRDEDDRVEMELVWVESEGKFSKEIFSDALELSKIACKQILDEIRSRLSEKLEKRRLQ